MLLGVSLTSSIKAVPYASELTNTGSSISFRLNQDADKVRIIYNEGATSIDLGAQTTGVITADIAITGTYSVEVTKTEGAGYLAGVALQISSDASTLMQFEQPVGVAVNLNPASSYFGRVYVSNSRNLPTATGRPTTEGIYVLNPDLTDALGQGDSALTGGLNFADQSGGGQDFSLPWRISVGEDDNLYIADFTTASGTVYVVDPNVSGGSGVNVLEGLGTGSTTHGQIASTPIVTGSLAGENLTLYALDADIFPVNGLKRWDVGAGPLPSPANYVDLSGFDSPLLRISRVVVDMDRAPDGKFFISQYRFDGNEVGVAVIDNQDLDGDTFFDLIYDSLGDTRASTGDPSAVDILRLSYSIKVSPDGKYLAVGRGTGGAWIVPLVDGLPNLAGRINVATSGGGNERSVCFDAAGNLYVVNPNTERLRVFSPGGRWVATTSSDGAFFLSDDPPAIPEITISSTSTNMYERVAADTASITVTRAGDTANDLSVNLTIGGTAINGVDYSTIPSPVVILAGSALTTVEVNPVDNNELTGDKTITVAIAPDAAYEIVAAQSSIALRIQDDEGPEAPVLFSDDFETESAGDWTVLFNAAAGGEDYLVEFGYDYSAEGIPPAPNSTGGTTKGVKVRVNKNFVEDGENGASAANLHPTGQNFSGDFAFRADALISIGTDTGGQTEHTVFGINHSGTVPNRHGVAGDGLWFAIDGDGSNNRGFPFYAGGSAPAVTKNNTDFVWAFTSPPWGFAGAPGVITNSTAGTGTAKIWADVEVRQEGGVVTVKVNSTVIHQFTNTFGFTSGNIMIGHADQFASLGSLNNYTIWDNVRVIDLSGGLPAPDITGIQVTGGNVVIDFQAPDGGVFSLRSSTVVEGPYEPDAGASFTTLSPGVHRATTSVSGEMRFYRVAHTP